MLKKYNLIAISISLLSLWPIVGPAQETLDDNAMVIYSLGYDLGKDIKGQQLKLDQEILLQGINDALAGNEPLIDAGTQRQALAWIQQQRAEENLRKGESFLAENAKKDGITTLPSGLQYRIVSAGTGPIPNAEDSVTVEFRGTLIDGTEFASSKARGKPATLKVNRIIKGLSEALQLMPTGSKWMLYIPPKLAYGKRSPGARVPANSTLIYEIELLSVKPAEKTAASAETPPQQ